MTLNPEDKRTPSLMEPESTGGDTAEGGFAFQGAVTAGKIPEWLAYDGFDSFVREAIGDIEASMFCPGVGNRLEMFEAKNHLVTPSEFWSEMDRFRQADRGSPNTYRWFTLACAGLSKELHPLLRCLRRLRGPHAFYEPDSGVMDNSLRDYLAAVLRLGHSEEEARFLFERVLIEPDHSLARSDGLAIFRQAVPQYLPEYQDAPSRCIEVAYSRLLSLVGSRIAEPISRSELETLLADSVDEKYRPGVRPIHLHTAITSEDIQQRAITFQWSKFFGGDNRQFPPPEEWNTDLLGQLRQTRQWITKHRRTKRIHLSGSRRLSASLAIGASFPAVAGFALEMECKEGTWSTEAHPDASTPDYPLNTLWGSSQGKDLVVSVGIMRDIRPEVDAYLTTAGMETLPQLQVTGSDPVVSPQQANLIARKLKALLTESAAASPDTVHLFYSGPAHLAVFLGHRLNATHNIQCYERVSPGAYTPTCHLMLT